MPFDFNPAFERALPYETFLARHGSEHQIARWRGVYDQVRLTEAQLRLLSGFRRKMRVLCVAGAWCGDCAHACPILQRIAEASPAIDLRFLDRAMHFDAGAPDADTAVMNELFICGGARVPVLVFLSEDGFECARFGERTLSAYRAKVAMQQGASCPIGVAPPDDLMAANTAEWLEQFERVQLMLLTSPRLMRLHGE